jgi:hypothetical protein
VCIPYFQKTVQLPWLELHFNRHGGQKMSELVPLPGSQHQLLDALYVRRQEEARVDLQTLARFDVLRPVIAAQIELAERATIEFKDVLAKLATYLDAPRLWTTMTCPLDGGAISFARTPLSTIACRWYKTFRQQTIPVCPRVLDEAHPDLYALDVFAGPQNKHVADILVSMLELYEHAPTREQQERCETALSLLCAVDHPCWYYLSSMCCSYAFDTIVGGVGCDVCVCVIAYIHVHLYVSGPCTMTATSV